MLRQQNKIASRPSDPVSSFHRTHHKSDISCLVAINRFAEYSLWPKMFSMPNQSRKRIQFQARSARDMKRFHCGYLLFKGLKFTFKLYVVFIMPSRSLLFPSGVGRMNMTVAFSIFAVRSPFDSDIACQAKFLRERVACQSFKSIITSQAKLIFNIPFKVFLFSRLYLCEGF